ncbi:MAG: hypothetical protein LBR80_02255 [Deltaproteobacteria bacterium]|jgi:hypothetical protein|nr:hypothetical protein [Deltaproteobacteria bacterium]
MREPRASPPFDRIWRLVALFALCGLIYYFSFDNGRQASKARIARMQGQIQRLEAENGSLVLQRTLLQKELDSLKAVAADRTASPASPAGIGAPSDADGLSGGEGLDPVPGGEAPEAFLGDAAAADGGIAGSAAASGGPAAATGGSPSLARLSVRNEDSRLIIDGQVLLSVMDVDSLDRTATVRVQHLDAGKRVARTMEPGDSMIITRDGKDYRLLLDQLKGTLAVFLLVSP